MALSIPTWWFTPLSKRVSSPQFFQCCPTFYQGLTGVNHQDVYIISICKLELRRSHLPRPRKPRQGSAPGKTKGSMSMSQLSPQTTCWLGSQSQRSLPPLRRGCSSGVAVFETTMVQWKRLTRYCFHPQSRASSSS